MKKRCIGDRYKIQCYKHNKRVHKSWNEAVLLREEKTYMVFANDRTIVTKADGNTWRTREPAIMYFFKNEWYNIIAQLKKDGIYYYCNIASPYIIEEDTIKYIDYDLDLRIFPTGEYRVLDKLEYKYHKKVMNYPKDLDLIIKNSLSSLITKYEEGYFPFSKEMNEKYCEQYLSLKSLEEE